MRGVGLVSLGQSGGGAQPAGVAPDALVDHELVHLLHVAGEYARLLDAQSDVACGTGKARGVVRAEQVVIDRLRHADAAHIVTLPGRVLRHAMERVHRVVPADHEEIADVEFLKPLENHREIRLLHLVPRRTQRRRRRPAQRRHDLLTLGSKINQVPRHKAFNPPAHAKHARDFCHAGAAVNDSRQTGVDNAGRPARLADENFTFEHLSNLNIRS